MRQASVVIVGGGFSGAAVAFHLAKAEVNAQIAVVEPRALLGAGLAYDGADPAHRVNVPASRMSLLPDDEGHFARWLEASGELDGDPEARVGGEAYPQRRLFGRYVDAALRPFVAAGRVRHVRDRVIALERAGGGWRARTAGGISLGAPFAVIATTHPPAGLPPPLARFRDDPRLIADPLADGALDGVEPQARVLIVGAGLTAADALASFHARGHEAPVTMMSRRGLRARGHPLEPLAAEGDFASAPAARATELLARVRRAVAEAAAEGRSWHPVFDALRIQGGDVWRGLEADARRRVVRHLRPYWDVHRFRLAPQIDAILERRLNEGSLVQRRARLGAVASEGRGLAVEMLDLRRGEASREVFDRVVVATGPAHGAVLAWQPFLGALADAGALAPDPAGLGLHTTRDAQAVAANGEADPTLFIAGPLARGTFGELMGLPHVAAYAKFVADRIAAAMRRGLRGGAN